MSDELNQVNGGTNVAGVVIGVAGLVAVGAAFVVAMIIVLQLIMHHIVLQRQLLLVVLL